MKYKVRKFKVPKELNSNKFLNEDRIYIAKSNNFIKVVLLDGASESFDSKTWARCLGQEFIKNFDFSLEQTKYKITTAIKGYIESWKGKKLSWSQQAAFQRGSFSTLVVFECNKKTGHCKYLCIGDSCIFLIKNFGMETSFPYDEYSMFCKHPYLVSTKNELNSFLDSGDFRKKFYGEFSISDKYNVLLMTDAISSWAMRGSINEINRYALICRLTNKHELSHLVERERTAGELKIDDTSVINIYVSAK